MRMRWLVPAATVLAVLASSSAALAAGTGSDVQMSGSASTGSPGPAQPFSYTFQVKNSGPDAASGVAFTDTLPAGTVYQYATVNLFSAPCSAAVDASGATVVSCTIGSLPKGSQATVGVNLKAPATVGSFSNTGVVTSTSADPQLANNSVTVNAQVKMATCPLPAGQPTTIGLVAWKFTDANGMFENFHLYGNDGVAYTVLTNFYDGTAPLTTVINLNCAQVPNSWIQVANYVYVTGTVGMAVVPGDTVATPVIYASFVQVLFFKDGI